MLSGAFALLGFIFELIAFQYPNSGSIPEWVYDMDATGSTLFSWSVFLCVVGLSKSSKIYLGFLEFMRIPTWGYAFCPTFNFCKEIAGANQDNSASQLLTFWIALIITTTIQYAIYKRNTSD